MKAPQALSKMQAALRYFEQRKDLFSLLAVVVILALCGYVMSHLLAKMRLADIGPAVADLPIRALAESLAFTAASFVTLVGYDWSAMRYIGQRLPIRTLALASFCGYAIGNTVGFSLLTGGSVRFRIYSAAGVRTDDVGRVALFCVIAFGFGICAMSAFGVLMRPGLLSVILDIPRLWLRAGSIAAIVALVAFFFLCHKRRAIRLGRIDLPLPSTSLVAGQLGISAVDLCFASAALYVLLPADLHFSFASFLPLYCVGIVAGLMSHVPGGLGVFEAVMVFALGDQTEMGGLVGALIVYRLIYFVLPLVLAGGLLGVNEIRRQFPATRAAVQRAIDLTGVMVPTIASMLIVIAAMLLLASGATPMEAKRAAIIASVVPLPVVEASHFLASLIASALIFLAPALQRRLNAAYWLAHLGLAAGFILSLTKGLDYEEALVLAFIGLMLLPYRQEFYRRSSLLDAPFTLGWAVSVTCILGAAFWLMLFAYKHVEYDHGLWFQFAFEGDAPRSLRAMFGAILGCVGLASLHLLRPPRQAIVAASPADIERARAVARQQGRADAMLVLMGDKNLLFSESGRSFLMYGRRGRTWINLLDPVGAPEEHGELIWRLRDLCDGEQARPAFYQIRPESLPLYLDAGLTLTKLGEEARVLLRDFDVQHPRHTKLRYALKRSGRDGLTLRVFAQNELPGILDQLTRVSDAWLAFKNVREKGFSMGAFSPAYIANFAVAAVMKDGAVIAFATLLSTDLADEVSLDVIRYRPDAPNLTMEFLITSLILEFKERGVQWFNLGMAPLSGLQQRRLAPMWHRVGALVFEHGEQFYNFRGLRQFKQKFDPVWEARYLASPGGIDPLVVLADAAALIAGGSLIGVVRK